MFSGLMILAAGLLAFPGSLGRVPNAVAAADTNSHGFDLADLDTTCNACQDFFQYANGGWIKRNPIPPEYASWGRFNEVQNHNQEILRTILEAAAGNKSAAPGSIEQKIGDFYSACMNTEQIEAAGIAPIAAGAGPHRRHRHPCAARGRSGPFAQPGRARAFLLRLRAGR